MALVDINWHPTEKELKQFARIWFPFFYVVVGALAWGKYGSPRIAWCVWGTGVTLSLASLAFPEILRWIFVGMSVVTWPIGWVVSHLLLGVIFYGIVTPIGFLLRLCGRDPLQRKFDSQAKTYWVPHEPTTDTRRYFRQY
jgi:hypothetical protein